MEKKLDELKDRLREVEDLQLVSALLNWDQSTYMPPGGAAARGRQMSLVARLGHEKLIDPAVGRLLDDLQPYAEGLDPDSDDAALIRVTRRQYDKSVRVPPRLLAQFNEHGAASYQAWTVARPANDFKAVQPMLEKTLDFSRQLADCFPGYEHIADPLIDYSDEGMKAESVRTLFANLREQLVPLLKEVLSQPVVDDSSVHQFFPEDKQRTFGERVIRDLGYDFNRGRQDKTHHPFMTKFSLGDVRITTRFQEDYLANGLFSTIHESGHAMYEQGIDMKYEASPLAHGTSAGVHESQSRLWENVVGRSRAFWGHYYPGLQELFPEQLGDVSLETFYRAINKVQPSVIRTEADQMTYDLHVMIRFDLELAMLEGSLEVRDLPDAWMARYESDLGITAKDDRDGCLQDVHWFAGPIGGSFQGYTLGNIMAAMFYRQALLAHPEIPAQIGSGEFGTLHGWLTDNIYRHGAKFTANDLVQRVTGGQLTIEPYISYLRGKFLG
ncbi:MAG: carboxypeptidase [Anaerolineae bacterium]|nr:MAG: carboxypeptidase [Anaerolineae bacterium]